MFKLSSVSKLSRAVLPLARCDTSSTDFSVDGGSLIEQANEAEAAARAKIRRPPQFENMRGVFGQAHVNSFDGFRCSVQKQINLNTVVSHFYWLGSQNMPAPMYQYRVILPLDDLLINVATDASFNIEGEVKATINSQVSTKSNFVMSDQANSLSVDVDYETDHSASQVQYEHAPAQAVAVSHMQAITPTISLGGSGKVSLANASFEGTVVGMYDDGEYLAAAQIDSGVTAMLLRRVNPNRVHLATEVSVNAEGSKMSVGAEYILKQSKIHMSASSNLVVKSTLDSTISPGFNFQLAAEVGPFSDHYRFGYAVSMG